MSYDQSSMYYNLQETLNTWPLSSIRGFACHSRLNNLHCTRLRRSVALIWPPELISATLVYACVYMSRAAHISEAALCAASVKIHAHASLLLKYSQNPVKFRCHDLSREEKISFCRITSVNGTPSFRNTFLLTFIKYRQSFAQICNGNAPNDSFSNKPYRVTGSSFRKAIWKTNA